MQDRHPSTCLRRLILLVWQCMLWSPSWCLVSCAGGATGAGCSGGGERQNWGLWWTTAAGRRNPGCDLAGRMRQRPSSSTVDVLIPSNRNAWRQLRPEHSAVALRLQPLLCVTWIRSGGCGGGCVGATLTSFYWRTNLAWLIIECWGARPVLRMLLGHVYARCSSGEGGGWYAL